jgi:tetratricopeptide (TPR) repeat protein
LRMCFTSCVPSTLLPRVSALLAAVLLAAGVAAQVPVLQRGGDVDLAWSKLDRVLDPLDASALESSTDELINSARPLDLRRLTPAALALVVRARTEPPPEALALLHSATRLDPICAEAWLGLAAAQLRAGSYLSGASSLVRGVWSAVEDQRMRHFTLPALGLSLLLAALAAFVAWTVLALVRTVPLLWHDLCEASSAWRLGRHGLAFAILALALPVFAAGDPVWLVFWLFALGWAYLPRGQKAVGVAGLILCFLTPAAVEESLRSIAHPPNAVLRATTALQEHRWEPRITDELESLEALFRDQAAYHRLRGDSYRMNGRLDAALWAYQEGLRLAPNEPSLLLALGSIHFLQGDYNAAVESLQRAREAGADQVVVDYNLSLTLAHTYHFHESDEAMEAAQREGKARLEALTAGRDHLLILPTFTTRDANALLASKSTVLLLNRGLLPPPLLVERTVGHPLALVALFALVLAIAHFLVRERLGGFATACSRCGRPFCHRCKFAGESLSYCTQCVNIFLKKDMVPIDAQLAKRRQLARRRVAYEVERRVADTVVPGLGLAYHGRGWRAIPLVLAAIVASGLGLMWLPLYVRPGLMNTPVWPLLVLCAVVFMTALTIAHLTSTRTK